MRVIYEFGSHVSAQKVVGAWLDYGDKGIFSGSSSSGLAFRPALVRL